MSSEVSLIDQWSLTPPPGFVGSSFLLPVTINLDGLISAGATFAPGFGRFLNYTLTVYDVYSPLAPDNQLAEAGKVTTTGAFGLHTSKNIVITVRKPLPVLVGIELILTIPGLTDGTIDFLHTGSIFADLPDG